MYVILTGSRKNAGDYVIAHAAKRLIGGYAPDRDLMELPSWLPVTQHLDLINSSKALILCGGPAIQSGLGYRIYPILKDLPDIGVPIIAFGLGWKAMPGDEYQIEHSPLTTSPAPLLERIQDDFPFAGCRDYLTLRVMRRIGLTNALMTGCPAWYDPSLFEASADLPSVIERVLVTPAEQPFFRSQSIELLRMVCDLFPKAVRVCSFHRGWTADPHTTAEHASNAWRIKAEAETLGYGTWDASGGLSHIDRYTEFDLHAGYRVHAHFKFLSMKKPSFLIAEDARGKGALEAIGPVGVLGYRMTTSSRLTEDDRWPPSLANAVRRAVHPYAVDPRALRHLRDMLSQELESGFPRLQGALRTIETTWPRMLQVLKAMPA